jgi:creatinine amidohydrolase/Fe(II)-dependent formamide hydrolase-like protein
MQKIYLFEMTRPEIEQAMAAGVDTVIVPLGSTEQHGLHLPLGTDAILGEAIGDRVARALGNALLAPSIPIGCSEHHMDFAGSLTLSKETFIEVVADVCRSLAHHGFGHIVLVPTHGGNFGPLAEAAKVIRPKLPGVNLIAFTDLMAFMDEIFRVGQARKVTPEQAGAHSGEFETSLMLSVRPDLVAMDDAQPGYVGDQLSIAAVVFEKGFRAATENGVLGDPSDASVANGEAYLSALTDLLVDFIKAQKRK